MIVRRFLAWSETAPAAQRAKGANALARAYIEGPLLPDERRDALVALTALLDDASPLVRRAIAIPLAHAADAPHHLIASLAGDQADIAVVVLGCSPVLSDAELIDHAALGDAVVQTAIASRARLSAPLAAALAEVGERQALVALAANLEADLPDFSLRRMLERMGGDGELRQALLARPTLSVALRHDLVAATAKALAAFVTQKQWLSPARAERVTREASERAVVSMSAEAGMAGARQLVTHLRRTGALTAGLMLRALLSGNLAFFEASLADLTQLPPVRVAGLVREFGGAGFAALYRKADLPIELLPVVRAALAADRELAISREPGAGTRLSREMIDKVMEKALGAQTHRLAALLRRYEAEAAREAAREAAFGMVREVRFELACDLRAALLSPEDLVDEVMAAATPLQEAA
jgi:uncharacterized protein (DUF2336 family)